MDIVQAVSGYMTKMVSVGGGAGGGAGDGRNTGAGLSASAGTGAAGAAKMKILVLDGETVGWCHNNDSSCSFGLEERKIERKRGDGNGSALLSIALLTRFTRTWLTWWIYGFLFFSFVRADYNRINGDDAVGIVES